MTPADLDALQETPLSPGIQRRYRMYRAYIAQWEPRPYPTDNEEEAS
jgi:hypothetical protein